MLIMAYLPDDQDDLALDLNRAWVVDVDGLHGWVGGLQPDPSVLEIKVLQGGLIPVVEPNGHHFAITGAVHFLHDYDVTVIHHCVNHGIAMHAQGVELVFRFGSGQKAAGDINPGIGIVITKIRSGNGHWFTGDDVTYQGDGNQLVCQVGEGFARVLDHVAALGLKQVDPPGDAAFTLQEAHFFQLVKIVVDHRRGADLGLRANFPDGWGIPRLILIGFDEAKDFLMPWAETASFPCHFARLSTCHY